MAITNIVRYIDTDSTGGDGTTWATAYNSMTTWESAEDSNLITSSQTHTVYCRASSGTNDNSQVVVSGWVTSTDNYLQIIGSQTTGSWLSTGYILANNSTTNFCLRFAHSTGFIFKSKWLQCVSSANAVISVYCTNTFEAVYESCIVKRTTESTNGGAYGLIENVQSGGGDNSKIFIVNCLLYDSSVSGSRAITSATSKVAMYIYNNTIYNTNIGIRLNSSAGGSDPCFQSIKNNRISAIDCFLTTIGFTDDDTYNNYNYITENNSTDVAVGTNGAYNQTFYYLNEANRILIPASSDPCVDTGVSMTTDAYYPFFDDITGTTRGNTWDVGCHAITITTGTTYILIGGVEISMDSNAIFNLIGICNSGSEIKLDISSSIHNEMSIIAGSEIKKDISAAAGLLIYLLSGAEISLDISSGITNIIKIIGGIELKVSADSIVNLIAAIKSGVEISFDSSALQNIIALLNSGVELTIDASGDLIEASQVAAHIKKYGYVNLSIKEYGTITLKLTDSKILSLIF